MKRICNHMSMIFGALIIQVILNAQVTCEGVTVSSFPKSSQSGQYDYYGVRVTLAHVYNQNVSVSGTIAELGGQNVTSMFSLTVIAGNLTSETSETFYAATQGIGVAIDVESISPCPPTQISANYAGVTITYEVENNILRFASISDVYAVLQQLDSLYDDNYDNYENGIDTSLSVSQLDSLDELNGFDPFETYRNFENLFSGYSSKRAEIESIEIEWLDNDFEGTSPTDIDLTFYDALNAICNSSNYSFKLGTDIYMLTSEGLYINGNPEASLGFQKNENSIVKNMVYSIDNEPRKTPVFATDFVSANIIDQMDISSNSFHQTENMQINEYTTCKSNKKKVANAYYNNDTERYELEVAIHSIGFRSGVHGKVIHFKKKNNKWKRSRAQMNAGVGGAVYSVNCSGLANINETNPYSGYKKREELKAMRHSSYGDYYKVWKTYNSQLGASFTTPYSGQSGVLTLTF